MNIPHKASRTAAAMLAAVGITFGAGACTSAIISADASATGRWMLWKHRDSGHPHNVVDRVEATDSTLAFVALFNAEDTRREEAWIGFNAAGFAVMNTASYNLAPDTAKLKDREGFLMSRALGACRTIEDFDSLLRSLPRPMGVQANFGAVDASGNGAFFETHDRGFTRHGLEDAPDGMLLRTNYSMSGGTDNRLGIERYENERYIIDTITAGSKLAPWHLTETLSRSFRLPTGDDPLTDGEATSPDNGESIARGSSCASVVIEGPPPGEDPGKGIVMWTAIGFPPLSVAMPATLDSVPAPLLDTGNGRSPQCDRANALRAKALSGSGKQRFFNLSFIRKHINECRREALKEYRGRHPQAPNR